MRNILAWITSFLRSGASANPNPHPDQSIVSLYYVRLAFYFTLNNKIEVKVSNLFVSAVFYFEVQCSDLIFFFIIVITLL